MSASKKNPPTAEEKVECAALKNIYEAKKRSLNLTHAIIADAFDISSGGVSHYLNGINALNVRIAIHFANILQCEIDEFSPRLAKDAHYSNRTYHAEVNALLDVLPDDIREMEIESLRQKVNFIKHRKVS